MKTSDPTSQLQLVVVVPACNEEKAIAETLEGLANQNLKPSKVIVVDDRSEDKTYSTAKRYEEKDPGLFKVVRKTSSTFPDDWHLLGEHIAEAFNFGVKELPNGWHYLAKIDADMSLDPFFFEKIIHEMDIDKRIGLASGVVTQEEKYRVSVRGGCRVYRKECWDQITAPPGGKAASDVQFAQGYAPPLNAWDTFLENKARTLGWKSRVVDGARATMQRPTGGMSLRARLRASIRMGDSSRRNGYLWYFFLARAARNVVFDPYILKSLLMLYGWLWSWSKGKEIYDDRVAEWVQEYQKNRLLQIIGVRKVAKPEN